MKISKKLIGQIFLLVIVAGLQYCEIYSNTENNMRVVRYDDWRDIRLWFIFFLGLALYSFFKLKLYRTVAEHLRKAFQRNTFVKLMIISLMILTVFSSFLFIWSLQRHAVTVQPSIIPSEPQSPIEDLDTSKDVLTEFSTEKEDSLLPPEWTDALEPLDPGTITPINLDGKATSKRYDEYAKIKIRLRNDGSSAFPGLSDGETDRQKKKNTN
uniref:Uncharacterized protein n=1 Tax=Glossina brevipalpis TaxID=37001 RepID=A0A1A9W574_9MUSC